MPRSDRFPLHLSIQPGGSPLLVLPSRGTTSVNFLFGYCGYSSR
jgi:hypothetical protein